MVSWGKIIFGGVDSSEYGIYITGEGVYNAPERDVEFVDIPGRNGAIALDQGRYQNIEVTYSAGVFGKGPEEFREALSDFRNAILSQRGYQKLEDTYHPEEFREAIYVAGLEVEPSQKKAGQFELTFNCKPQRWLSVGALPVPVDSGDILGNPTIFDSSPLLEITGYGSVEFNGYTITLDNIPLGDTPILSPGGVENTGDSSISYDLDSALFNVGDTITVKPSVFRFDFVYTGGSSGISVTKSTGDLDPTIETQHRGGAFVVTVSIPAVTFTVPANGSFSAHQYAGIVTMTPLTGSAVTATILPGIIVWGKDGDDPPKLSFIASVTIDTTHERYLTHGTYITETGASVDSSVPMIGNPTYIDCDLGEAYKIEDGDLIPLNKAVAFGSDLPTLSPGLSKVTFDNTITDMKITPRWWRI